MFTIHTHHIEFEKALRPVDRLLLAVSLLLAWAIASDAQTRVPGNAAGRGRWVRIGPRVENGTLITVNATGRVSVGSRGSFGPEGTISPPNKSAPMPVISCLRVATKLAAHTILIALLPVHKPKLLRRTL